MTVTELITELGKLDGALRVAVEDADTQWCAPVVGVEVKNHPSGEVFAVIDPGSYYDMLGEFE